MKELIDIETGKHYLMDTLTVQDSETSSAEAISQLANDVTTLQNNDDELGEQVQAIQGKVNYAALLNALENIFQGKITVTGELLVQGDTTAGESFLVSFANGTCQIATNNGLDILSDTTFLTAPKCETISEYDATADNEFVTKKQVEEAIKAAWQS